MKVETISIGNELLYGRIVDTNASYLAKQLSEEGLKVHYHTVVGDNQDDIVSILSIAIERSDMIITTGGLGPTKDDITRDVIADFTENELLFDESSWEDIKAKFFKKGINIADNNRVQAMIPKGARIINNGIGTAPGFCVPFKDREIISLPGVPYEMKLMTEHWVLPHIRKLIEYSVNNQKADVFKWHKFLLIKEINSFGISESLLGEKIEHLMGQDKNPLIGTQASINGIKVRLCANANSKEDAVGMLNDAAKKVKQSLGISVYGEDDIKLEDAIYDLLNKQNMSIATAESCTGGLIASLLTNVPGISEFYLEGIVAYSNEAKTNILNVPEDLLIKYGAVSSQVASAMASGVRKHACSDIGIGTTGIAGPSGGTEDKPVGLVFMAVDIKGDITVKRFVFSGNRLDIKNRSAHNALNMLRVRLLKDIN